MSLERNAMFLNQSSVVRIMLIRKRKVIRNFISVCHEIPRKLSLFPWLPPVVLCCCVGWRNSIKFKIKLEKLWFVFITFLVLESDNKIVLRYLRAGWLDLLEASLVPLVDPSPNYKSLFECSHVKTSKA